MVEPTVVSTQASSSPSYGPNIAPAKMFCRVTSRRRPVLLDIINNVCNDIL